MFLMCCLKRTICAWLLLFIWSLTGRGVSKSGLRSPEFRLPDYTHRDSQIMPTCSLKIQYPIYCTLHITDACSQISTDIMSAESLVYVLIKQVKHAKLTYTSIPNFLWNLKFRPYHVHKNLFLFQTSWI